jgi:hypothetical protein
VLSDALEKHCIQAEPILDKNALAGKKVASAHLPLWICRRFSTDAAVYRRFAGWLGCLQMQRLPAFASQHPLSARFVVLSCTGVGFATFFLKTKNTRVVLALFADLVGWAVRLLMHWLSAFACQHPVLSEKLSSFLPPVSACHFLPEDKKRASGVGASFCLVLPSPWSFLLAGPFRHRGRFFHAQPLSCIS